MQETMSWLLVSLSVQYTLDQYDKTILLSFNVPHIILAHLVGEAPP
jgi:hypothetical protein